MMTLERLKQITDEMVSSPTTFAADGHKYFVEAIPNLEKQLFPTIKAQPKATPKVEVKPTVIEKKVLKKKKKSW